MCTPHTRREGPFCSALWELPAHTRTYMQIKENWSFVLPLCDGVGCKKGLDKRPHFSVAIHMRNGLRHASLGVTLWKEWFL